MILANSLAQARATRIERRVDTFEGHITDFIATYAARAAGAQAFLVEQDPNWVTPTHFHFEHQFQVVTAGSGLLGRNPVGPYAVHYAAPETGYGPITAGPEGIAYLTLRAQGDTGAQYLHKPGSRERMRAGLKREQKHGMPSGTLTPEALAALTEVATEILIEPRDDGLGAWLLRLPPGSRAEVAAAHSHGGRHYVLTQGAARLGDRDLEALAVAFVGPGETVTPHAGARGAELLVLQFPRQARQPETPA